MLKQIEILILDRDSGEIKARHRETMQLSPDCHPETRFEDFARGFVRVLRDSSKFPNPCIQITATNYKKSVDYKLFPDSF